jgi:integral membrane protein (TIGR01906 family)
MSRSLQSFARGIAIILVPIVLILTSVRLVLNPWFLEFEYRTPNFPADSYGFSQEERLRYARIALDYLLNEEDISFLAEQRFPAGEQAPPPSCAMMEDCTRMYNQRELQHMVDVKEVVQASLKVWYGAMLILMVLGVWAWRGEWVEDYRWALARGGLLTLILIFGVLLLVLAAFGVFFVAFHEVFFEAGTWTFLWSDTLIRLFPERFWRDTFLVVGGVSILLALLFWRLFQPRRTIQLPSNSG